MWYDAQSDPFLSRNNGIMVHREPTFRQWSHAFSEGHRSDWHLKKANFFVLLKIKEPYPASYLHMLSERLIRASPASLQSWRAGLVQRTLWRPMDWTRTSVLSSIPGSYALWFLRNLQFKRIWSRKSMTSHHFNQNLVSMIKIKKGGHIEEWLPCDLKNFLVWMTTVFNYYFENYEQKILRIVRVLQLWLDLCIQACTLMLKNVL